MVIACVLASAGAFAGDVAINDRVNIFTLEAAKAWRPSFKSLDEWLAHIGRKEWRVIYKNKTQENYVALFLDQDQHLVVATTRVDGELANESLDMRGENNQDLHDLAKSSWLVVETAISPPAMLDPSGNITTVTLNYRYAPGEICTIDKDYKGKIHIVKKEQLKKDDPWRVILDYTLDWPVPK